MKIPDKAQAPERSKKSFVCHVRTMERRTAHLSLGSNLAGMLTTITKRHNRMGMRFIFKLNNTLVESTWWLKGGLVPLLSHIPIKWLKQGVSSHGWLAPSCSPTAPSPPGGVLRDMCLQDSIGDTSG